MRTCVFVLTRLRTQFNGYTGNRAVACFRSERSREWGAYARLMVRQWNMLREE